MPDPTTPIPDEAREAAIQAVMDIRDAYPRHHQDADSVPVAMAALRAAVPLCIAAELDEWIVHFESEAAKYTHLRHDQGAKFHGADAVRNQARKLRDRAAALRSSVAAQTPDPTRPTVTCACGHSKDDHAGQTHRGTCYPCYSEADHAPGGARRGTYCGRYRKTGTIGAHHKLTPQGYNTGATCPGVDQPPAESETTR